MSGQLINKLRKPRPPWRARCSSLITRNIEASDGALVIVVFRRKAMSWLSRHQPDYREAGRGLTQRVIFLGGAELGARRSLALNNGPRMRRVRPVTESAMPWLIVGPVTQDLTAWRMSCRIYTSIYLAASRLPKSENWRFVFAASTPMSCRHKHGAPISASPNLGKITCVTSVPMAWSPS